MPTAPPPMHSVWENKGRKVFVADVVSHDDGTFVVSVVLYVDRYNLLATSDEVHSRQWAELVESGRIRMTSIEPV